MTAPTANKSARSKGRYSHSGICVSDLQRSIDFYRNVLGFEICNRLLVKNQYHKLLEIDGDFELQSVFLHQGGLTIELLDYRSPGPIGSKEPRSLRQLGLVHLSFNVDDLDTAMRDVERWAGRVLASTRTRFDFEGTVGDIVLVTDPDGTRIELMAFPQDVRHYSADT